MGINRSSLFVDLDSTGAELSKSLRFELNLEDGLYPTEMQQ